MGLTDWQLLWHVELPLALGVIQAGIRVATVITVGVAPIAAAIGAGGEFPSGLGRASTGSFDEVMKKAFLTILTVLLVCSCGSQPSNVIVVGSKNFTEQEILGEMLAQYLHQQTGLQVERKFNLSGTYICQAALLAGRIDAYVEYTGTALTTILHQPVQRNAKDVYSKVKSLYAQNFNLTVMPPLGFDHTFVLAVRGETARKDHIRTISGAVPYALHWQPGFGDEFMDREDGYKGLVKTYRLKFGALPTIMDQGLLYSALLDRQLDVVAGNSTDAQLEGLDFVVLQDNKHYFPPYQAVPIVRTQILSEYPAVYAALEQLAGKISSAEMRHLNYEVATEHRNVKEVVEEFLRSKDLVPGT
jgi:glycine betaine/choline ABC-type transport system substrate-binding protein